MVVKQFDATRNREAKNVVANRDAECKPVVIKKCFDNRPIFPHI
jgi:hypothetical protein